MDGTMAKILYGKGGCWIWPVGVLLSFFAVITAQPAGFLSISCGANTSSTDENNITWVTDADYIDVGHSAEIGNATVQAGGSPLDSLRFFPKPLTKSCYQLPVPSNVPYLLRLWFIIGNYSGFQRLPSFAYSFETVDMLAMDNITLPDIDGGYDERIMATSGTVMYVCLIRTSDNDDPFISGIELRPLRDGMYAQAKPGTLLSKIWRVDAGGNSNTLRYPQDNFDRMWTSDIDISIHEKNILRTVSSQEPILTNITKELLPNAVMQTAWVANTSDGYVQFSPPESSQLPGSKSLLLLYFAEIETLNMSESRSFNVTINGETEIITLARNYSFLELTFVRNQSYPFSLSKATNSTDPPIINAYEYYWQIDRQPPTYSQDIEALETIKKSFDIKEWISDPCYLIHWKGIGCDNKTPSGIRISEIDLSRRNLTGSVPNEIVHLTALVNV